MPLELDGFQAHVQCDGQELEQYDVQSTEDRKVASCWIASEAGKAFTVHWRAASADTIMMVRIYIDGRQMMRCGHSKNSPICGKFDGVEVEPGRVRSVVFSLLILTDDEEAVASTALSEKLGTIEMQMFKVERYIHNADGVYSIDRVTDVGPIHEKSKKAGVHAVSLGDAREIKLRGSYTPVGLAKEPFATFIFRYRPIELLQANRIAPLAPKASRANKRPSNAFDGPSASQSKRRRTHEAQRETPEVKPEFTSGSEDEDDDEDDVTFLEEQLAMLQKRLAEKKGKKRGKVPVKREPSPIRVPALWTGEVIDLT